MVAWPQFADQHVNAAWIAERGLGVAIPGTKLGGGRLIPEEEIADAVKKAEIDGRNAATALARAASAALAPGGSTERDFKRLMQFDLAFGLH